MKILLVHNTYRQPGGEDVVLQQEKRMLEDAGHEVLLYLRSNWEIPDGDGVGIKEKLVLLRNTVWSSEARHDIQNILSRERPDIAHVHNTFTMISPSIYSACQDAGVPVVQTLHNYRLFCPSATFFRDGVVCEDCVDRSLLEAVKHSCYRHSRAATTAVGLMLTLHRWNQTWSHRVDRYIALTAFARERFVHSGLSAEKISVKPNFVDPDPGIRANKAGSYALFVGRLSPEKRVSTLLQAWTRLSDVPLVIVGGGPEQAGLENEAVLKGLQNVTFKGQLGREDTIQTMGSARFLVFSSEWYENFQVTIAESFACGVPVVCSRLGAMAEIVEHGRTGLHFEAGNPIDLANAVRWAWENRSEMERMGREAREEYKSKYTAKQNYPVLMDIYRQAIASRGKQAIQVADHETHSQDLTCRS